jgi:2-polyprenyl-3-methyl-5-hydroxy-6-metoxy-1,4-benzoquinol methylase
MEDRIRRMPPARRLRFRLALEGVERFSAGKPLRLLDAGAGEGFFAEEAARRYPDWTVVAADASAELLAQGARRTAGSGLANLGFAQVDLTQPIEGVYDAVVALECLTEIPDDDAALRSMAAALRPGGLFVAHVPAKDWEPVLRGSERAWRHEIRHGYERDELADKLEAAGLAVMVTRATTRGTVHLAQELRDRTKTRSLKLRALIYPLLVGSVPLERLRVTWGSARGLYVEAERMGEL